MKKLLKGLFVILFFAQAAAGFADKPGVTEKTIKLVSRAFEVHLDPTRPDILSYRSISKPSDNLCLWGATERLGPEVALYDTKDGSYKSSYDKDARLESSIETSASVAVYKCKLSWKGKPAAEFELIFSLTGNRFTITSRLRKEHGDFKVSSIRLQLVSVKETQPGAKLAMPRCSGRLVDVAKASPVEMVHKVSPLDIAPVGMIYHEKMLALVSLSSPDDQVISTLGGSPKTGGLSVEFIRRPRAAKPALQFLVQNDSTCAITIMEPRGGKPLDWTAGASLLRDNTPRNVNTIYSGSFIYSIQLDCPDGSNWTSLNEAMEIIDRVNRLTGGAKQVVYLSGWRDGSAVSDADKISDRVELFSQLVTVIQQAKLVNAVVSVADNYSTVFKETPDWNESIIAIDSKGEPAESSDSGYIISPAKYVRTAQERARKTVESLGIQKTILLEKLSDDPDRMDFDPVSPANRQTCINGKSGIISGFNRLGIDAASDFFTSPFAARMSYFRHINKSREPQWADEEIIPLIPMIYHGKVTIGETAVTDEDILDLILSGWTATAEFNKSTPDERITDLYYLVTLPANGLAGREITGYEKKGSVERVSYSANTYVEVDRKKPGYAVVRDGIIIAANFTTMMPLPDGRIAVYSRNGGKVAVDLAGHWRDTRQVKIECLVGSDKPYSTIRNGRLTITTAPRAVYRISYGRGDLVFRR